MSEPKFCKNCMWSQPETHSAWTLKCLNPRVNSKNSWALASAIINGSTCSTERSLGWSSFPACGMKGKQYSPLEVWDEADVRLNPG